MKWLRRALPELDFAARFLAASIVGFATDAGLLDGAQTFGATPEAARIISLLCAMQAAFFVNLWLLGSRAAPKIATLWPRYMATQGLGNLCNYGVFVLLVSRYPDANSLHLAALVIGAVLGWFVNYLGARFLVFGKKLSRKDE